MCEDADIFNKVFDPFNDTDIDLTCWHNKFQQIIAACNFHKVEDIQNVLPHSRNNLNIFHLNVRSIINKRDNLLSLIKESNVQWHAIAISETWLNKSIENMYELPNFCSFFSSRENRIGGGAGLYINSQLNPTRIHTPQFTTADVVCVELDLVNQPNVLLCQIYKPPNTDKHYFIYELEKMLVSFNKINKTICIAGDFNFDLFTTASHSHALDFFTTMSSYGFFPTIFKTTRCTDTSASLLDNIFCNDLVKVHSSGIILHDMTDHFPIFSSLTLGAPVHVAPPASPVVFDYRRLEDLKAFLTHQLLSIDNESDPEIIWKEKEREKFLNEQVENEKKNNMNCVM